MESITSHLEFVYPENKVHKGAVFINAHSYRKQMCGLTQQAMQGRSCAFVSGRLGSLVILEGRRGVGRVYLFSCLN